MNIINVTKQLDSPRTLIPLEFEKVLFLILHHAAASNYTWEQCNADHKANGWFCAGYNEMIYKNGDVYILRGDNIGAQCANNNSKSYGICCVGDYDTETQMPEAQFNSLIERLVFHKKRFKNLVEVALHNKFNPTACPGIHFPFAKILDAFNNFGIGHSFEEAIQMFVKSGIINSPEYWLKNAVTGGIVNGEFVRILITRIANKG